MIRSTWTLLTSMALAALHPANGQSQSLAQPGRYETGYSSIAKITTDLYKALDAKKRGKLMPVPVLLDKMAKPYIQPNIYSDGTNVWQAVYLSQGLINFVNAFSHAKALEGGDFEKYLSSLSTSSSLPDLKPVSSQAASFDTMNHQVSNFNQIVGTLMAIEMAHHYLGHYKKYELKLTDALKQTVPINKVITASEWHDAVMKGAHNALDCGLGVDGYKTVLETIGTMKQRPDWAVYLVHPEANPSKLKKELTKMETDFFMIGK